MSPYEVAAREKKAIAIAMYVVSFKDQLADIDVLAALRQAPAQVRRDLAAMAGQKKPSDLTWNRVLELVRAQIERQPVEADAFAGLTEIEATSSRPRRGNGRGVPAGWAIV